jgi:hypothetical protein
LFGRQWKSEKTLFCESRISCAQSVSAGELGASPTHHKSVILSGARHRFIA